MRIGIFTDGYHYPVHGGVNRVTFELVRGLAALDKNNEYILFNTYGKNDLADFGIDQPNFRNVMIPGSRKIRLGQWMVLKTPAVEKWTGPLDVMHAPCNVVPPCLSPFVTTIYDLYILNHPSKFFSPNLIFGNRVAFRQAMKSERICCISEATRRDVLERLHAPKEKTITIPLGVSSSFRPEPSADDEGALVRKKYGIGGDYFIYVCVMKPGKNHVKLLKAYEHFLAERPNGAPWLVLAGQWWENPELSNALNHSPARRQVVTTGYVDDGYLPALLRGAKAMVFPSLMEGFGLPLIEAMACGTPVAASDILTIREVAADSAMYFNPENENDIAAAMARLADDPHERKRLAAEGLKRSCRFSWEEMAKEYLKIYLDVARKQ